MQRISLVPYDHGWSEEFARELTSTAEAMGDALTAVHHIGSTAIPGIHAKPIIDMLAVVPNLSLLDARTPRVQALGYEALGEFGIEGRRYFRKSDGAGNRTHHIHAFAIGSPQIERHLAFRDFMRAHPEHAQQYDALKRRLAESIRTTSRVTRTARTRSSPRPMREPRRGATQGRSTFELMICADPRSPSCSRSISKTWLKSRRRRAGTL
jgi:GrpB-like predicted nucleotidyltransferase (UPF0157 family)